MKLIRTRAKGSGLVETAAGLILIIPVLFCLIDVAALVIVQTANDSLAKSCARAAADFPVNDPQGLAAATNRFTLYQDSGILRKVTLLVSPNAGPVPGSLSPPIPQPNATAGQETVVCVTTVNCVLPIPVPFGGPAQTQFVAYAVEPIVGQMP